MEIERFNSSIPRATVPYIERPSLPGGGVHGAARWLTTQETIDAGLYHFPGVMFGWGSQGYLTYNGDRHSMIVAPPGAGKGVGFVLPNLLTYPGSMIVIDPKGENAAQTAQHRREVMGHDVYILDPCGVTGLPSDSYNPLGWLEETSDTNFMAELRVFAAAVIENGLGKETHWSDCARSLLRGLLCYLAGDDFDNLNLNEVYRLVNLPLEEWRALMRRMSQSTCSEPELRQWIRNAGAWFLSCTEDHQKYHLGTVQEAVSWMGNLGAARIMGQSDFNMRDLKRKSMTVYLCVHPLELEAYRSWFRLLVSQSIMAVSQSIEKPRNSQGQIAEPVLFMLDEYARAVGRLSAIDNALPQIRGYGGRFAFVLQTIGQLKELYPQGWSTFEETCGLRVYLQSEGETAEHVSKRLGPTTTTVPSSSGFTQTGKPLQFPQQIEGLDERTVVAFVSRLNPLMCHRITTHEDNNLKGFLRPFNGARALTSDVSGSLIGRVRAARQNPIGQNSTDSAETAAEKRVPPPVTAQQKADLTRLTGGWEEAAPIPAGGGADAREAALCSRLSRRCGKPVFRNANGIYGYRDETGNFIELG